MGALSRNRDGVPVGVLMGFVGALMTSAALMIIFRELNAVLNRLNPDDATENSASVSQRM
jgi:hypothetical protein